jgi:hypothetical protein
MFLHFINLYYGYCYWLAKVKVNPLCWLIAEPVFCSFNQLVEEMFCLCWPSAQGEAKAGR